MNLTKEELRIGNYVSSPRGIERVSAIGRPIDVMFSDNTGYQLKYLSPIPLTEELLLRCGFEKQKCGISGADMWQGLDFWVKDSITFRGKAKTTKNREVSLKLANYINTNFDYLHQLQNIFYFLSGEELTLKD